MRYQCIDRPVWAFQEAVAAEVVERLCRHAFGSATQVIAVEELPFGSYNNTYRVELLSAAPVVLRIAPRPDRQFRVEHAMMRNEYATAPYLAPICELLPRILFADFTHQVIGRDYMFQTLLPGVPAPEGMARYTRPQHASFFRQIGAVARRINEVTGSGFGPVAGPRSTSWSQALLAYFGAAAQDVDHAGHDAGDVRDLAAQTERLSGVLDQITQPRLLHGDGWTANFLVNPQTTDLTVTGVCDWDRAEWGDPLADWAIQRALIRPGTERDAFWIGYGRPRPSEPAGVRQQIYLARHILAYRLDLIRPGRIEKGGPNLIRPEETDHLTTTYEEIAEILARLRTADSR